jgi:hypothetical protein
MYTVTACSLPALHSKICQYVPVGVAWRLIWMELTPDASEYDLQVATVQEARVALLRCLEALQT